MFYHTVVTMMDKGEGAEMMYPEHFQGLMPGDRWGNYKPTYFKVPGSQKTR